MERTAASSPTMTSSSRARVKAVYNTLNDLFGKPVVHYMVSGTSPMPVFCKEKNIPAALFGCISSTANIHAPNEHLAVSSYMDEIKMIAGVMEALGKL